MPTEIEIIALLLGVLIGAVLVLSMILQGHHNRIEMLKSKNVELQMRVEALESTISIK